MPSLLVSAVLIKLIRFYWRFILNYFEQREKSILKDLYSSFYTCSQEVNKGITINPLRCTRQDVLNAGIDVSLSPFCKNSFIINDKTFKVGTHPYHHAGAYYVQEPSAAAPAQLLNIQKGDLVLDVCAAPGGKSAQLAAALEGEGLLVSNEIVPARGAILRNNLERMGFINCCVTNADTKSIAKSYPKFFNKVLADVPCSGEGMFRKEKQALLQHSEKLVLQCAQLGAEILQNAADCLTEGGTLVYSTCTFSPQENEMQIGAFLQNNADFEIIKINASFGSKGEPARAGEYCYNANYSRRIYPCHKGEGHFMAVLRRKGEISHINLPKAKTNKPHKLYVDFINEYFNSLSNKNVAVIKNNIFIRENIALDEAKGINIISQGVLAGSVEKNRFVPAHALFMAYGTACLNIEKLTLQDTRCHAFLRGEEIKAKTSADGYCAILVDNMPLGFGKTSNGMIKNHYPKGLRNLK